MIKKECAYCGKQYETDTHSKYCSSDCAKLAEEKRKQEYSKIKTRICARCGKEFQIPKLKNGNYSHKKYCSDACANNVLVNKDKQEYQPMKKCEFCGKMFDLPKYKKSGNFNYDIKYCSEACKQNALEKWKQEYQKNKKRVCVVCGKEFEVPRITDGHFSETIFCSDNCRYLGRSKSQNRANYQRTKTCQEKYGVDYPCLLNQCRTANTNIISNPNKLFYEFLKNYSIDSEFEFTIKDKAYDLHIKNTNILIEINPTYTHTIMGNHYNGWQYNDYYINSQLNKTITAEENNYYCIHIWDWDNWKNIVNMLLPKQKLYARKLQLKEINKQQANAFLNKYHIQNKCNGNIVNLGLYFNSELVQVMTFGKPRYNKNYQYELLRLCSHKSYMIVGGAERLFKCFVEKYNPKSVLSYCDVSKFTGKVYERLGFNLKQQTRPQKVWSKNKQKITDNLLRMRGYDQLFNTNYGKGTDNEELMLENGWLPIYDCGQKVFEYIKKEVL